MLFSKIWTNFFKGGKYNLSQQKRVIELEGTRQKSV